MSGPIISASKPVHRSPIVRRDLLTSTPSYSIVSIRMRPGLLHSVCPHAVPGGESFLTSLPAAIRRMPDAHQTHIASLEFVQRIQLPPGYDRLSDNSTERPQATRPEEEPALPPTDRVEKFVFANPRATHRMPHRILLSPIRTASSPPSKRARRRPCARYRRRRRPALTWRP